ncbi:HD-GYP domain-containing protein [Sporosarcina beigongshangi]|uniref:HD-GYP domain-containing protein n=1 Tax=Sporosarcina beigongshangi TaxID=2782538 RepID=UPI001939634B|nr:HD domain-containing phosphohydrolase [Sporosarcina beigongshangi]
MKTGTVKKHINEVMVNEILASDIFVNGRLVIAKNTILTEGILVKLKKRRIKELKIITIIDEQEYEKEEELTVHSLEEISQHIDEGYKAVFCETFEQIVTEQRYGKKIDNIDDLDFIMDLFIKIHNENHFIDKLYQLKEIDQYSFIHSFDVFVLGTLFAKTKGIANLESAALGYLFHDIGKLYIPIELLKSKRKLSHDEFKTMQKHAVAGYELLNSLGQHRIAHYAKSHHERMDGSGYPERLTGKDMSTALKILHLVDVYSALTLKRPYKEALHASEALEILLRESYKFDSDLLSEFIEFINIYPLNSTVLLSDNSLAIIEQVNEAVPMLPKVKRINSARSFDLPYDFKLTISKMLYYQTTTFREIFKGFMNKLLVGDERQVMGDYIKLVDGLRLEEIYIQVIMPTYRILDILQKDKKINYALFRKRIALLTKLLQEIEDNFIRENHYHTTTLFVLKGKLEQSVYLKVIIGLLHIERVLPIVVKRQMSYESIQELVRSCKVERVCFIRPEIPHPSHVIDFLPTTESIHLIEEDLVDLVESISNGSKSSVNIYEQLYSLKAATDEVQKV